jgi:hypothetical protein
MPTVDVTDILFDPDIAGQGFTVIRRQETVNNFGESTWVEKKAPAVGSVQPDGDNDLMREDAFDAQARSIIVVTTFRLRGVSKGPSKQRYKPDIIFFDNTYFEVISVSSWSAFGAGFIDAKATEIQYVGPSSQYVPINVGRLDFSKPSNAIYAHGAGSMF